MWDIMKVFEAIKRHFHKSGGFFKLKYFIRTTRLFEVISREMEASA
jgi:hypothetical protein